MSAVLDPSRESDLRSSMSVGSPTPTPVPAAPATAPDPLDRPRNVAKRSADDWFALIGSIAAAFCMAWLLYYKILPFSGKIGFTIIWYALFVGLYTATTALSQPWPVVVDRFASAVVHGGAGIVGLAVGSTLIYTFVKGWPAMHHLNFYTQDSSAVSASTPLTTGGIKQAIVGSAVELGIAVAIALPLGLITAIYLTEVGGRLAVSVRTVIEAMTALPDLVAGLFIYTVLILPPVSMGRVGLAAALAIAITMLPIIARSSEVVLRSVSSGLREASAALGAPQWQTVLRVVIPTARAGLGTALILGIARGVGETAPVLITSGASNFFNANPLKEPMNSLPLYIYNEIRNSGLQPNAISRGYGAASVLLIIILILFVFVRLLSRERSGR